MRGITAPYVSFIWLVQKTSAHKCRGVSSPRLIEAFTDHPCVYVHHFLPV